MVLQGFVDDSRSSADDRDYVLAGYMTTVPLWAAFSDEWSDVLAEAPSIESFHAVEAESLRGQFAGWDEPARDAKVLALAEVIARHPLISFDCRMSQSSFERILRPVCPYDLRSPYFILFHSVMVTAARQLLTLGISLPIDFIFDEHGNIGAEAALWYGPLKAMLPAELRPFLGARPIFRDDKQVLPLQATDALSWHLRRSREERYREERRPALKLLRQERHAESYIPDAVLQTIADKYRAVPGLNLTLHKEGSVKASMIEMESEIMKLPSEEQGAAYEKFNATMRKLLTVPPEVWQAALEHAKRLKDAGVEAKREARRQKRNSERNGGSA